MSLPVKILFRFHSSVLDEETVETLHAEIISEALGLYKIDSIPFYVPQLACGDIVVAEYDDGEAHLTYRETIEHSGNSTVQVILLKHPENVGSVRELFREMGCESEGYCIGYFVMHIPADLDYMPVKIRLEQLSATGELDYAEPLLSDHHRVDP